MRHANLSIFVPHLGCPHQCSFCNQRAISGAQAPVNGEQVTALCARGAQRLPRGAQAEIAFFGGSFTAIDRDYMLELLKAASPFVKNGTFSGIRISTRPDYLDHDMLRTLGRYGVTSIELGAQSMDDSVLMQNRRGHCAADVENAAKLVKEVGFNLGLQMMTGLFGSSRFTDVQTALKLVTLKPASIRIYPTIVMEGTALAELYRLNVYRPQTLAQAVDLGAELLELFEEHSIPVIRMGLHDEPSLRAGRLAGPHHPAFRELCEGLLMARRIERAFHDGPGAYLVHVSPGSVSKLCGHGAFPVEYLRRLGYNVTIGQDKTLAGLEFRAIKLADSVDEDEIVFAGYETSEADYGNST